jgi:hypothetical protein
MTLDETVRLWLTGGRDVLVSLGPNGGMKKFILEEQFPFVASIFPVSIISSLRGLTTLHFTIMSDPLPRPGRHLTVPQMASLPRSLTDLELGFNDCLNNLHAAHLPPLLTRLILPFNRSITNDGLLLLPTSIIELDLSENTHVTTHNIPPNVTSLTASIHLSLGDTLPSNLVTLHITKKGLYFNLSPESFPLLPPSLTQLKLSNFFEFVPSPLFFPQNLLELDLSTINFKVPDIIDVIPKTLKALALGWNIFDPPNFSDKFASKLPRSLDTFKFMPYMNIPRRLRGGNGDYCPLSAAMLPLLPDLKTLHIWALNSSHVVANDDFKLLPYTLTDLNIRIGGRDRTVITDLPPNLTNIAIRTSSGWDQAQINLPKIPNVEKLQIGSMYSEKYSGWVKIHSSLITGPSTFIWPSRVTAVNLRKISGFIRTLPRHLKYLEVSSTLKDEDICDLPDGLKTLRCFNQCHITDDSLPAIPHEIECLDIARNKLLNCEVFRFPSSLRHLSFTGSPSFNWANLPSHLTYLECNNSNINDYTCSLLPRSITQLVLPVTNLLSGACLQYFNPNMYRLELDYADFSDADIPKLPRLLRILKVQYSSEDLSSSCCGAFPPLLKKLCIPGSFFLDSDIAHLPRSLKTLKLPGAALLTSTCLPLMPKGLEEIQLPLRWTPKTSSIKQADIFAALPNVHLIDM